MVHALNILKSECYDQYFEGISKDIVFKLNQWILIHILLMFIPKGLIDSKSALVR